MDGNIFTSISQYLNAAKLNEKNRTFQARPIRTQGTQLYTKKDLSGVDNPAVALLRLICIFYRISEEDFVEMHRQLKREMGKTSEQINQDLGNLRKNLKAPRLTIDKLEEFITIFGYDIVDYSITLRDKQTGNCDTFHSSQISDMNIPTTYEEIMDTSISDDDE